MKTQTISSTLVVSLLISGCQAGGSASRKKSSDQTPADAAAERNHLQQKLDRPTLLTSASDRYKTQVKLANANTKASPLQVPDYNEYAGLVAQRPQDKEAKVGYAKALIATSDRAGRLYTDPHASDAVAWMNDVISKHTDRGDYYLLRARCQEITGQPTAQVATDVAQAAKLASNSNVVRLEQAKLAMARQNYAGAQSQVRAVLKHTPDNAEAHYLNGTLANLQQKPDVAAAEYAAALRCQPDHVDALTAAALNDWSAGRSVDFQEKVQRIRGIFPQHPVVYFGQAVSALQTGNRYAAVTDLQQASAGDPGNRVYSVLLQRVRIEQAEAMQRQTPGRTADQPAVSNDATDSGSNAVAVGATILVGLALMTAFSGNDSSASASRSRSSSDTSDMSSGVDNDAIQQNNELCNRLRDQLEQEDREEAEQRQREQDALAREQAWEQQLRDQERASMIKEGKY